MPNMATRVKLHKLRLGVVPHTKWAKHQQLVINRKWGRMSSLERAEFLQCPCGAEKQTITHVLNGCPVAHRTLVSGLAHVPGVTAFDKFSRRDKPRLCREPGGSGVSGSGRGANGAQVDFGGAGGCVWVLGFRGGCGVRVGLWVLGCGVVLVPGVLCVLVGEG